MVSTLVQRVCDPEEGQEKLGIHALVAAVRLHQKGETNTGVAKTFFKLTDKESLDFEKMVANVGVGLPPLGYSLADLWLYLLLCESKYIDVETCNELLLLVVPK